jgi:6-phosphogluconolactonase
MTEIIKAPKSELEKKAAQILKDSIVNLLKEKDQIIFAIPGGRSVSGVFQLLKEEKDISWDKVHIFMVDERLVPLDHPDSNFKLAKESFIDALLNSGKLPKENVHPFMKDLGMDKYEEELKELGGAYDIVLLSSGEDGHIGALYPNHHSIKNESDYYLVMPDSPKPPPDRMTMSRKLLLRSKVALIVFLGEGKKEAYIKFLDDTIDYKPCPAKLVQSIKQSFLLTDLMLDVS